MSAVFEKPPIWQRATPMLQGFDGPLAFAVFLLACAGLLVMYSSGFDHGTRFRDHGRNMLIAASIMFVVAQVPPQRLMSLAVPLYTVGVALLIAVADALKKTPPAYGVDLLFVDGEDYGEFGDLATHKDVLIGATYFAEHLPSSGYQPIFGVVWDMIGDADLLIQVEAQSAQAAPEVVTRVWQMAADLGYAKHFVQTSAGSIDDDHVPLLRRGLRVIDVIDLQYGPVRDGRSVNYHHTTLDTVDKVSARSLQVVGDVATALVTGN